MKMMASNGWLMMRREEDELEGQIGRGRCGQKKTWSCSPVVGRAGFVYLHQTVVFVSGVVRRQDVHLVPLLGLLPAAGGTRATWHRKRSESQRKSITQHKGRKDRRLACYTISLEFNPEL